ncbi:MAG: TIR domain-containing protein [Anaerolineae bacterium]|nr:TIR domain-containing protein [Anaerolineae bacterium]
MTRIFISHATENDDFVTRLAADLRAADLDTWVDHENIRPSQDWDAAVESALESSGAMVLVLSPDAVASQNVKVEWSYYLELGKPVYPVLLQDCEAPFRLRLFQRVDLCKDYDKALQRLLSALASGQPAPRSTRSRKAVKADLRITPRTARQVDALLVLSGHRNSVKSVAFSRDGTLLASGSEDKNVRLWYTTRRTRIRMLIGHEKPVTTVAFSPNGGILASASEDRTIRLWDVAKRYGITAFRSHTGSVNGLVFSPDGATLASASDDGNVRLWNMKKRQPGGVLAGHDGPVNDVAFSPDGAILVSAGADMAVRVWNVADRREESAIAVSDSVRRLAFSPDGELLALALDGSGVAVFNMATQTRPGTIFYADYNANCVRGVAFSPDGVLLAMASLDGSVRLWRVADLGQSKRALRALRGHEGGLCDVAFSPDGQLLATASHDDTLRLWSVMH